MKKFLVGLFLLGTLIVAKAQIVSVPIPGAPGLYVTVGTGVNALPLENIANTPGATNVTMGDDDWRNVPLQFNFPYFGKTFNNSWMLSNGALSFQDPMANAYGMCCSGMDLTTLTDTRYNYTIFPLWTDLIANGGSHWVKGTSTSQTYGWYGVAEYYGNNRSSFEVKIDATGRIDTRIGGALVTGHPVTSGMTGDLSKGEYYQYYHGYGLNIATGAGISWSAIGGTGSNVCFSNPLADPTCPGFAEAYLQQQCTANPLYNPSCPGYQTAYFNQQCFSNPLYNEACPGYQTAYKNQQCSLNPLYATDCEGYEQAYFNQQCNFNQLYSTDCPGYALAYFNQQCELNGLYSTQCPNYATAYAAQQALNLSNNPTPVVVATVSTNTPSATPQVVADPVVNTVITSTSTSTSPATTATAPVQLIAATPTTTSPATQTTTTQETKPAATTTTTQSSTETKSDQPKTARQELQERRQEAAKKEAAAKGNTLAKEMDNAKSMEQQTQVQGVVVAAMSFVPGFDAYSIRLPDASFYRPYTVYGNQRNVDNRRIGVQLFGATDKLHNEMVDSQYNREK